MSGFEPLPGRLVWAPDGLSAKTALAPKEYQQILALDLCKHAGGKSGAYKVSHWPDAALGFGFGPLGLDCLMHFCRGLDALLQHGRVALVVPTGDQAYRLNALVLLGGYLIMRHAWTAKKLAAVVRVDAKAKFECSWSRTKTPDEDRLLTVKDCWAGIELGVKKRWLDVGCAKDDGKLKVFVETFRWAAHFFDAAWIIPGLVMVAADPIAVLTDGDPLTCKKMFPGQRYRLGESIGAASATAAINSRNLKFEEAKHIHVSGSTHPGQVGGQACALVTPTGLGEASCPTSLETVQEDPCEQDLEEVAESLFVASDFATFFTQSNIGMIVRANWDNGEGLPTKSYSDEAFRAFGIGVVNIRTADRHCVLPTSQDILGMLQVSKDLLDPRSTGQPAVLVHCKGGFGRSVVLACCLAIHRFNLSGAAVLGWVRMARPGAVTCWQQELFLKSLTGRADVAHFARLPSRAGCALQ